MHSPFAELTRVLVCGAWSQNRGRLALTLLAIALGVALGTAVHLINHSAAREFEIAVRALSGNADVEVSGPRSGIDEEVYPRLARHPDVAVASPLVELEAKVVEPAARMRVIGIDPFRALMLQPGLLGEASEQLRELLQPGTVMLSSAAARQLRLSAGDTFEVQVGLRRVRLRVIATLPISDSLRQPVILMDIASAQWAFDHLGRITRIDLRLRRGARATDVLAELKRELPAGVVALEAKTANAQGLALSRAYRVNLNMLALVSLFTGAVLVFSTQALSVLRRRTHLALLRAIGVSSRMVTSALTLEAAIFGTVGTGVGLVLGAVAAHFAIVYAGGDLGAGYFSGVVTRIAFDPSGMTAIALCGILASLVGGVFPAIEAGRAPPASALRAGDEQAIFQRLPQLLPGASLVLAGGGLSLLPAVDGLPLFGYAALACLLLGALLLMPAYVRRTLTIIRPPPYVPAWLAMQQLRGAPGYAGVSLAAIVAAFSLTVAMLIMIHSFRGSLGTWLETMLPADLYARAGASGSAWIDPDAQARLLAAAPVARVVFSRFETVRLDPARPPITLIARDLDPRHPEALPLVSPQQLPTAASVPVWVSEAARDVYGMKIGDRLRLPLAGKFVETTVAGIWRDYVRQSGAILVARDVYIDATGDRRANEAWIWLRPGHEAAQAGPILRQALGVGEEIELREPGVLRRRSLAAFDRTFAVTYALQVAAILIGLFGISVGTSAQALARRREFGMLHHLGVSRRQLATTLGVEGGIVGGLGALAGLGVGGTMSLVLIHVINRQSFHWSMDFHLPWLTLAALGLVLTSCAAVTAALSVRRALGSDIVRAVKEDW